MREILAVLLLLAAVEGNPFWEKWNGPFQPPGHTFQPPGHTFIPPGHSFQPPGPPFPFPGLGLGRHGQQNWYPRPHQPGVDISNAEWVCTNMKTRDMIVITAVEGSQTVINGQTLPSGGWPNTNDGSNSDTNFDNQNPNNGNINNVHPETAAPVTYAPVPQTTESTREHAGEGIIDIRMGGN
ncbi:uncharacterized protein LOC143374958 [Andrena cerasifolii]|uniref:uncharacterized protein LOC143374958 n=1 Tax=Andrena cerasifolii TaxID=2819439 RepID=UPI004038209B